MRDEMETRDTAKKNKTLPFHPAYGLHDTTRATILKDTAETSVPEAARKHNVAQSTIYRWRAVLAGG